MKPEVKLLNHFEKIFQKGGDVGRESYIIYFLGRSFCFSNLEREAENGKVF